jgi:protein associated with RNAse G/E
VFQVYAAGGVLKGWYCNLSSPASVANGELTYRDLALDVFVRPDGTWVEDDRDEYDANVATLYAPEDVAAAERGLAELMALVRAGALPNRAFPPVGPPSP